MKEREKTHEEIIIDNCRRVLSELERTGVEIAIPVEFDSKEARKMIEYFKVENKCKVFYRGELTSEGVDKTGATVMYHLVVKLGKQ